MPSETDRDPGTDPKKQNEDPSPAAPPKHGLIGQKLGGRYLVERELGHGGMGAVYLARDKPELHGRPVVVKVLLEQGLRNEWILQKFQQEIESLTRLDDPGVVGIFDAGTLDDGAPYLVMQYVDGPNLRTLIKAEGFDLGEAAGIIRQIGRSVSTAHDEGILHRDLKPENIMLRTTKSGEQQVKIIDFGIAKVRNSVSGTGTVTGMTAGTIAYMSPEQLNAEVLTPASDVFSVGVIAYEMIAGKRPFSSDSILQLYELQRTGECPRVADLRPGVPEAVEEVIRKALAFNPQDRFQRAQDFGDQLAAALTSSGTSDDATRRMPTRVTDASSKPLTTDPTKPTLETAHVLFMDIVGYSKLLIDEQTERLQQLQEIVRNSPEFQRAQAANQLLRLPTGDGMALSFLGDPESPVRCAVEINRALRSHPEIKLRMGVHSGLVYRMADINANMNVAGGGINIAQRVMDCGDAGHILVSQRVAHDLAQLSRWAPSLHDLGEVGVKHGARVHIYNLYNDEVGNAAAPAKLRGSKPKLRSLKRWLVAAAASLLLMAIIGGAVVIGMRSQPTLTYSLTVQKMSRDQKVDDAYQSTGQEPYGNGWEYRMNITAGRSGYLYMINEGTVNYNALFPTEANKNHLAANQTIQTPRYSFDTNSGVERVYLIFSTRPLSELDTIVKDAAKNTEGSGILKITDPAQIKTVRDTIARYSITEPAVDKSKKQSIIKGTDDVLVSLLELEHNQKQ